MNVSCALEVRRNAPLEATRVVEEKLSEPGPGEVLLTVERFGLASNNISYALLGDLLGHWAAFPASEPGWGRVPAWGRATVQAADPSVARVGSRYLGYLPMATHVLMRAAPDADGLRDISVEREAMLPMYRTLRREGDLPEPPAANVEVIMLPVTPLAAMLDEFLRREPVGALVVSSATSKTTLAFAKLVHERGTFVVGLTSASSVNRAQETGAYDLVVGYDGVSAIPRGPSTVYVDVAGRPAVTAAVHERLGDVLTRSIAVGGSHLTEVGEDAALNTPRPASGPEVERFSAGQHQVTLGEELGGSGVTAIEARARDKLVPWISRHLDIDVVRGLADAGAAWTRLGRERPGPLTATVVVP